AQGYRVRAAAPRKAEVEVQLVVHGIEVAQTDDVEVPALRVPGGAGVAQHGPGGVYRPAVVHIEQHDGPGVGRPGVAVREPPPVRRPRGVFDPPVLAVVEAAYGRLVQRDQQQLVAVVGDRDAVAGRGDGEVDHPANVEIVEYARRGAAVGGEDHEALG